jgi:hypothetical protein
MDPFQLGPVDRGSLSHWVVYIFCYSHISGEVEGGYSGH